MVVIILFYNDNRTILTGLKDNSKKINGHHNIDFMATPHHLTFVYLNKLRQQKKKSNNLQTKKLDQYIRRGEIPQIKMFNWNLNKNKSYTT